MNEKAASRARLIPSQVKMLVQPETPGAVPEHETEKTVPALEE
jgi:hypothetical protein